MRKHQVGGLKEHGKYERLNSYIFNRKQTFSEVDEVSKKSFTGSGGKQ